MNPRALTPWDRRLFGRTVLLCFLLTAVALTVAAATDEPQSTWIDRLTRVAALSPLLGGGAVALVVGQLARRGEGRTLAACGQSVWMTARGSLVAAASFGSLAALFLVLGRGSLRALFPTLSASPWQRTSDGFLATELGMQWVLGTTEMSFFSPVPASVNHLSLRLWVAALVAGGAWIVPGWVALPCGAGWRFLVGFSSVAGALLTFHLTAVGAPAFWLWLPLVVFAVHILWLRRQGQRR